jgi:hypothetical protein
MFCTQDTERGKITLILPKPETSVRASVMRRTDFVKLRLTDRTPFVVGIMITELRSRERSSWLMQWVTCRNRQLGIMYCVQQLVEISPISWITLDPPDEKLL